MSSLPGPSSTPYNWQNKATENFSRLCQLIVTICSDLFRDILSRSIPPANLRAELDKNKNKLDKVKSINPQQKRLLYPDPGKASPMAKDLDFSVLYVLIRNICGIKPHKNGWGDNIENGDNSIAACIDRIRLQRNLISGHSKTGSMDNASFHSTWTVLENSIIDIEKQLIGGNMYKRAVNALYLCELSPSSTKRYVEEINRTFKSEISKKKARIDGVESQLNQNSMTKKARLDKVEDQQNSVTQEIRERLEEFETSILSIWQGRDSALKEYMKGQLSALEENMEGRFTGMEQKLEGRLIGMEQKIEERVDNLEEAHGGKRKRTGRSAERQPKDIFTEDSSITTKSVDPISTIDFGFLSNIRHIAYVKSGHLWVSGSSTLLQISLNGNKIDIVNDALCLSGSFAVRKDGVLFYIDKNQRYIKEHNKSTLIDLLKTRDELLRCIHVSKRDNSLLVVIKDTEKRKCRVIRYDMERQGKEILIDGEQKLFEYPSYITENSNGDVVVSDGSKKTVVVVNSLGQHRFNIKKLRIGSHFSPHGTCTDDNGRIFVVDTNPPHYIHIFDQDGNLSQQLHTKNDNGSGLCVDDEGKMFVGNQDGTIDVYRV